jgi:hypothetical protein
MKHIKRREAFDRQINRLMKRLGAKSDPTRGVPWSCYTLETKAGRLDLSVHTSLYLAGKDWANGGGSPWVAARFDDVKAARKLTGDSNPYSGKWNHHLWHNWTDSFRDGLELLEQRLRGVLLTPTE